MAKTMTGATATACRRCHEWIEQGTDGVWTGEDGTACADMATGTVHDQHQPGDTVTADPVVVDGVIADIEHEQLRHWVAMWDDKTSEADKAAASHAWNILDGKRQPLLAVYDRYRWQRWYLVTSSSGHLHTSTNCSTCFPTTEYGWITDMSGMSPDEAVTEYSWRVCTVCVPAAPTLPGFNGPGRRAQAEADANGACLNREATNLRMLRGREYGDCAVCGEPAIPYGWRTGLRKHTHRRNKLDAERRTRLTDPKLIGTPAGDVLKVDGDVIRTVRAAEIACVDMLTWAAQARRYNNHQQVTVWRGRATTIAEALAAKAGETTDQVHARLAPRVARKLREYGLTG